jgi:phosphohistidine phosphatase
MYLFLLRHGNAVSSAPKDSERPLSTEGRAELHSVLSSCKEALASVDCVVVSPYLRAQQTCAIAREYLPQITDQQQHTLDFLTPAACPQAVIDWAYSSVHKSVLFVTHQPLVGTLLDELCGFEPGLYRMGTAALAMVRADVVARGLGELIWLKQP